LSPFPFAGGAIFATDGLAEGTLASFGCGLFGGATLDSFFAVLSEDLLLAGAIFDVLVFAFPFLVATGSLLPFFSFAAGARTPLANASNFFVFFDAELLGGGLFTGGLFDGDVP
jgi:hypothetical protein